MQSGLSKKLMDGIPRLNSDLTVTVTADDGQVVHTIPSHALTSGGIGYLYERLVGLHYESNGYAIEYRNHLGYFDRGVDLIARNDDQCRFVQCKFTLKSMGRAKVESLLFAASAYVQSHLEPLNNHFDLVVPFEEIAFPCRRLQKKNGTPNTNTARDAFLKYNSTQQLVRLNIIEVPMEWNE